MLWPLVKKEYQLLARDLHAIAVLFLMPSSFLIIMAVAMSGINQNQLPPLNIDISTQENTDAVFFKHALEAQLPESIFNNNNDKQTFIKLDSTFSEQLLDTPHTGPSLYFPATADQLTRQRIKNAVTIAMAQTRLRAFLIESDLLEADLPLKTQLTLVQERTQSSLPEYNTQSDGQIAGKANSSQLSVPAWLIFGMFFIMLPMANSFQQEQLSGTLLRFRTMQLPLTQLALSKLLPYIGINLIQFIVLLAIGIVILPLLGLPALQLTGSFPPYLLLALCITCACTSFGLFIASIAKSTEQALLLSAGCNILLAAIGGIMVPKNVMPETMQYIAELSPMSWALDSFLTLLVGQGGISDILPWCIKLFIFSIISLAVGLFLFHKRYYQTLWTSSN